MRIAATSRIILPPASQNPRARARSTLVGEKMKEIRIGRPGRLLSMAVFVLLLGACSLTIGTSPNAYPFPSEKVFSVRPDVAANITNFYTEPEVVELERNVYSDL